MTNALRARDMAYHFHSQTNPRRHEEDGPLMIVSGDGAAVVDAAGKRYIESMSGLWCAALGFENARLADVAAAQMRKLAHYHTFNHRSNDACVDLIEQIAELSPLPGSRVFLAGSGSEANDSMVKLAWYYHLAKGEPQRRKIISRQGAFHGSTVMGAALSGLKHMHESFNMPGLGIVYAARPHFYREAAPGESEEAYAHRLAVELEAQILEEGPETIAAMIAEPIMGAGGVVPPPAGYFPKIAAVLRKYGILLLADEVVCGFGRTGRWFGSQTYDFTPDMMSLAKGLSSGYLPIAAVVVSDEVYQTVADEADRLGVFAHGFTYSGHPVTAAVAAEVLRIYKEMNVPELVSGLGERLHARLNRRLGGHALVGEVRGHGLIAGIELVADRKTRRSFDPGLRVGARVESRSRAHGVIIRNMGDALAVCPPFIIRPHEIDTVVDGLAAAIDDVAAELADKEYSA